MPRSMSRAAPHNQPAKILPRLVLTAARLAAGCIDSNTAAWGWCAAVLDAIGARSLASSVLFAHAQMLLTDRRIDEAASILEVGC